MPRPELEILSEGTARADGEGFAAEHSREPACTHTPVPENPGEQLDQRLAEDQAWREERQQVFRRKLIRARRLRVLGPECCVAAGLTLPAYWLFTWMGSLGLWAHASTLSAVFAVVIGLQLVTGLAIAAGVELYPHWLGKRANRHDFEAAVAQVEMEEARRRTVEASQDPQARERQNRLKMLQRKEATYRNLCLIFGALTLFLGAASMAGGPFLASLGFEYLVPSLLAFCLLFWLPLGATGWALARFKRHRLLRGKTLEGVGAQDEGDLRPEPA